MSTAPEAANKATDEEIVSLPDVLCGRHTVLGIQATDVQRLAEHLRTQAIMLDQTQDAIIIRDFEDRILFWNRGAERLYGWTAKEAVGQNIYELLSQRQLSGSEGAGESVENGEWTVEMRQITKDSKEVTVESRSRVLGDETGHPKSVLIVNTDITEKKMLECQFLRAQRMEGIGRLAGGIAHDLNKVLSPMLLATRILREKSMKREDRRWLETLRINAEHAGSLITQLMSLARGIEGERTSIQLGPLIRETVSVLRSVFPESITIKTRIASDLWTIVGNATHVYQVLVNLCVNARDAMPKGGVLTIDAQNTVLGAAQSSDSNRAKGKRHVLIKVSDTGIGIPNEIIDKVFEPFFTTKHEKNGTGLGLSTVLRIVTGHKGVVSVSSEPGRGTQFKIFFLAEESANAGKADIRSEKLPASASGTQTGEKAVLGKQGMTALNTKHRSSRRRRGREKTVAMRAKTGSRKRR